MVWEPFALAVVMGLLVSAAIYFIVMWPQVEPPDDVGDVGVGDDGVAASAASDEPATSGEPAP